MKPGTTVLSGLLVGLIATAAFVSWPAEAPKYLLPGEQWLGEPVHDLPPELVQTTPIQTRAGCFWGQPGSNPWRGNTYSALRAMFVEPDAALELSNQIREKQSSARVYRSNLGIWTSGGKEVFSPISAQAYGRDVVCFGTTANFRSDDAIEVGSLYHVGDAWVAVWDACRNVDRLIPVPDAVAAVTPLYGVGKYGPGFVPPELPGAHRARARVAALLYPLVTERPPLRGLPIPHRTTPDVEAVPTGEVHTVPEPSTIALMALAVPLMLRRRV